MANYKAVFKMAFTKFCSVPEKVSFGKLKYDLLLGNIIFRNKNEVKLYESSGQCGNVFDNFLVVWFREWFCLVHIYSNQAFRALVYLKKYRVWIKQPKNKPA